MVVEEIWKDVLGWENYLEISNIGRVRSKRRLCVFKDNKPPRYLGGKLLKLHLDRRGYPRVKISCPEKNGYDESAPDGSISFYS